MLFRALEKSKYSVKLDRVPDVGHSGALVAKTGVLPDPAVVVVRRPGVVTATLGVSDRETVEQAVAEAKG